MSALDDVANVFNSYKILWVLFAMFSSPCELLGSSTLKNFILLHMQVMPFLFLSFFLSSFLAAAAAIYMEGKGLPTVLRLAKF